MMDTVSRQEGALQAYLSPWEGWIMQIQSLLVWEKPRWSVVWLITLHILFWCFYITEISFYSLCSLLVMAVLLTDVFINKIWKRIKLRRRAAMEDSDSWTPVHPHLLSVPELCQYTAEFSSSLSSSFRQWLLFRREHPLQFCIVNSYVCLSLAIAGCYIPGIIISYIIGIAMLVFPCIIYYRVPQKISQKLEPVTSRVCYVLSYFSIFLVVFRAIRGDCSSSRTGAAALTGEQTDELNLDDLCPDTAALSTAASESDGEGTPGPSTPALSENQSIENSEDEGHESDLEQDLAEGLGEEMPSFDDHTDDELLDSRSSDTMQFVPTHFEDSDSDEGSFGLGLELPGVTQRGGRSVVETERNIAEQLVAQAMGSMMKAAVQGSMMKAAVQGLSEAEGYAGSHRSHKPAPAKMIEYETATVKPRRKVRTSTSLEDYLEQSDTELADDFEFLDPTELDDEDHHATTQ